ncbi:hypothetical protein ACN47E_004255 [Coniothyrium glycines]
MPDLFNAIRDVAKGAQLAANAALWTGHTAARYYNAAKHGVCLVCNNLQPYNHEETFGRAGAGLQRNQFSDLNAQDRRWLATPTLVLKDLKTKEILKCRPDKQAGVAENKCKYCRFLFDIFESFFVDEWMDWKTETMNAMQISFGLMIQQGKPLIVNCTGFVHDTYLKHARMDVEVYYDPQATYPPISDLPMMGPSWAREIDVRSPACSWFIQDSVRQCCTQHAACNIPPHGFTPTRLLYVGGGEQNLRLCETHSWTQPVAWVALSHCWGGKKPLSLIQETYHAFQEHIDIAQLPNTFKDAITVTMMLGLPYLWIDSLCIIQGDKDDWAKEASRMASVYSYAFTVVTTGSSESPDVPILGPREEDWLPKRLHFPLSQGVSVPIMVRKRHMLAAPLEQGLSEPPYSPSWAELKQLGPLYNRGWCFQEAHLATRNLQFTPGAIVFECKTHRRSEDQLPPYPSTLRIKQPDPTEEWRMIVKAFTSRQLSFGSDKLPAIAGAATIMPQARSCQYLAGLWSESLHIDLLWHVRPYSVLAGHQRTALSYPDDDGGPPTWSWASMKWQVDWFILKDKRAQPIATIVNAQTQIANALNPYGEVNGGTLRLRGRIKYCTVIWNHSEVDHCIFFTKPDGTQSSKPAFLQDGPLAWTDKPLAPGQPEQKLVRRGRDGPYEDKMSTTGAVFFLISGGWLAREYMGLVLGWSQRAGCEGCFERVGVSTWTSSEWYDSATECEITIV